MVLPRHRVGAAQEGPPARSTPCAPHSAQDLNADSTPLQSNRHLSRRFCALDCCIIRLYVWRRLPTRLAFGQDPLAPIQQATQPPPVTPRRRLRSHDPLVGEHALCIAAHRAALPTIAHRSRTGKPPDRLEIPQAVLAPSSPARTPRCGPSSPTSHPIGGSAWPLKELLNGRQRPTGRRAYWAAPWAPGLLSSPG